MNLYSIDFAHAAPKDIEKGIKCYLLAENDEQVYEWIKSEPKLTDRTMFNSWADAEEENEPTEIYDEDYNVVGKETFKEKMIRIKGEMNDYDYDYCDAYYGITLYGWTAVKENVTADFTEMIKLGIIYCV